MRAKSFSLPVGVNSNELVYWTCDHEMHTPHQAKESFTKEHVQLTLLEDKRKEAECQL